MAMAIWEGLAARVLQRLTSGARCNSRCFTSITESSQSSSSMQALGPIAVPPFKYQGAETINFPREDIIWSPFMRLMAVPKRKVSPSRKGKRNGPKALKPVPVIAKCKVCGRIKLPHFYCCSGEASLPQQS